MSKIDNIGIVGYGAYIPIYRIKIEEIASQWNEDAEQIKKGLNVECKSVRGLDEDEVTIAVEAAWNALKRAPEVNPKEIGAIYIGSESKPYAVKPSATIVATAIGASFNIRAADYEFACKAGTEAIISCIAQVKSKLIKYGLAIGADCSQSWPGDVLEYTAAAGGAAFIIGEKNNKTIAYFEGQYSVGSDTADFWRRDTIQFPRHTGRFTGEPAYFKHVIGAAKGLMEELNLKPKDFDYFVPHQPNGSFPLRVAKQLGFEESKVKPGLISPYVGNFYSGSSPVGFCKVLDQAKPGERVLLVSFGSGAGADAFSIVVQDCIEEKRNLAPKVEYYLNRKVFLSYGIYSRHMSLIRGVNYA
jgi:hydroxymethylglutaryl-CoA synthase